MFIPDFVIVVALITLGLTLGAVGAMILFVRRQRGAMIGALRQTGQQQLTTAQQLASAIEATQRQQRQYEQQLQNLAQATLRLRQEVQQLSKQAERTSSDTTNVENTRILH